ncbi:response regulator [Colwellia psychrerythraea]|uniref:Response regulator receiver protein n=1 Tax=Colwellia psychrerythraea TaxID=28229 RepID=A0A099K9F2_COLPS|nr:response regulator [Colwellia psychrerythraea]KGJ87369.1 response regulator receiver protein [Colwellia psychrerythraea]
MSKTILVVDDSLVSRMMIKTIIQSHVEGVDIIEAGNGVQGLDKVNNGKDIDIAFVDFNMPGMTGLELIGALAEKLTIPKVALLTANIQDEIKAQAIAAGVTFMNKPINEEVIATFLHR